jgi:PKD repeat protein
MTLRNSFFVAFAFAILGLPLFSSAQCTPDQTMISATHYPSTLAKGCVGQPYNETIYITFPDDSVVSGANVIFDYFKIVSNSLPAGLTYTCNVPNCKWTPTNTPKSQELMFGCITISGTPTAAFSGQFTIDIEGCGTVIIITQCETEIIPFTLTIFDPPNVGFSTVENQNQVTFSDLTTTLDVISSWSWDFGDGTTSSLQDPVHTYSTPGNYDVCLTVVTTSCTQQFCDQVMISSVSADPFAEFAQSANLYPNPIAVGSASGSVTVELGQATRPTITLRSIDGRLLKEWQFTSSEVNFRRELSLDGIPAGMYFLDIRAKEGKVVKKLQIH